GYSDSSSGTLASMSGRPMWSRIHLPSHHSTGVTDPLDQDLEVQVIADSQARGARSTELLALLDLVAFLDGEAREMAVERCEDEPVVDDDGIAVDGEGTRAGDDAGIGSGRGAVLERGQIEAQVDLGVDLLVAIAVGACLREVREDLGIARLD